MPHKYVERWGGCADECHEIVIWQASPWRGINIDAMYVHGAQSDLIAFVQFIEQGYPLPGISVVLFRMLDEVISAASSRAMWPTDICS